MSAVVSATSIWTVIGGCAGAISIIVAVGGLVVRVVRGTIRSVAATQTEELGRKLDERLVLALQPVYKELSFNGGGSLKDYARNSGHGIDLLNQAFIDYRESNDRRMDGVEYEIRRLWLPSAEPPSSEPPRPRPPRRT